MCVCAVEKSVSFQSEMIAKNMPVGWRVWKAVSKEEKISAVSGLRHKMISEKQQQMLHMPSVKGESRNP